MVCGAERDTVICKAQREIQWYIEQRERERWGGGGGIQYVEQRETQWYEEQKEIQWYVEQREIQ